MSSKPYVDKILNMNTFNSIQSLVDSLLLDIYGDNALGNSFKTLNKNFDSYNSSDNTSTISLSNTNKLKCSVKILEQQCLDTLKSNLTSLKFEIKIISSYLIKQLIYRDKVLRKRQFLCNLITELIVSSKKAGEIGEMKFSLSPPPLYKENSSHSTNETTTSSMMGLSTATSDFNQWLHAMKMVARLPGGMPPEFRKKLWLALSDKHIQTRKINWNQEQAKCLSEQWRADDEELGVQIVKDLHRTGSSLCSGPTGSLNQAKLKRVLLGYARWNPEVGYCQGFNMLGAIILQVMDRNEADSIKVMILLVEGVLPSGYFSGSLGGLQADMAVFRELLASRLPKLAKHLQKLQGSSIEGTFEPPLTNVFTMQWFLTLFCTCLPINCVLRVWDLILIEGSDILLRTALAIWGLLEERILNAKSADDFYCKMGLLSGELLNGNLIDSNGLVQKVVDLGPIADVQKLRDKHLYNISPWRDKKGLKLFYSDDEGESDDDSRLAVTTAWGVRMARRGSLALPPIRNVTDNRDRLALDISLLKQQYTKLRERQRQAHIILTAACARQSSNTAGPTMQMNQFLLGRNAILSSKGRRIGPPLGAVPPARKLNSLKPVVKPTKLGETLHWKDTDAGKKRKNSLKWKDLKTDTIGINEEEEPVEGCSDYRDIRSSSTTSSLSNLSENPKSSPSKTRRRSESSSYSEESDANSSTSTSLCDDENIKHSQPSSVEHSPLKKKISPEIEVPEMNKNEDIQKYIDNIKETFLESQYEDIAMDELLLNKKSDELEIADKIIEELATDKQQQQPQPTESIINLLIDLNVDPKIPEGHLDKFPSLTISSLTKDEIISEDFIKSPDLLTGIDIESSEILCELPKIIMCVNDVPKNYNENVKHNCDEIIKVNFEFNNDSSNTAINQTNIEVPTQTNTTNNNDLLEVQVNHPDINIELLRSDEEKIKNKNNNDKSPLLNISSISQLSPIPDITKYISMSSISPLRTPSSHIDYTDYMGNMTTTTSSLSSALTTTKTPTPTTSTNLTNATTTTISTTTTTTTSTDDLIRHHNSKINENLYDVSDEGVTNQLFERMNASIERPTRLDLSGLYEKTNLKADTNYSNITVGESIFRNDNIENINTISISNQSTFASSYSLELPLTTEHSILSILPSCTNISSISIDTPIHKKIFDENDNKKNNTICDQNNSSYFNERTNFFKEKSISLDEPTKDKISFKPTSCPEPRNETVSGKNSDRVLKIIQENSLILHRILRKNSTKIDEGEILFENISKINESPVQEITSNNIQLAITDSISEQFDSTIFDVNINTINPLNPSIALSTVHPEIMINSSDQDTKTSNKNNLEFSTNTDFFDTRETLSATLSSIENTINSINILCEDRNPIEKIKNKSSFEEEISINNQIVSQNKNVEKESEINVDVKELKINNPIINIVESQNEEPSSEVSFDDESSNSFVRLGRDSRREPSPRRKRFNEIEENINKSKRNISPSNFNRELPYKPQTLDRLCKIDENKRNLEKNYLESDKFEDYLFKIPRDSYRQQQQGQKCIFEDPTTNNTEVKISDNDIESYLPSSSYSNRGPPEKPNIRHTTVTCTFYDRYLSQKKEQSAKVLDKSPSSPIITKAYLDSLKPFPDRIIKSAENSPSRMKYETSNIIIQPVSSPILPIFSDKKDKIGDLFNFDYHVRSCDNILVKLGKEVKNDDNLVKNNVTKSNTTRSFSPLPTKPRHPTEIGLKLGLYQSENNQNKSSPES